MRVIKSNSVFFSKRVHVIPSSEVNKAVETILAEKETDTFPAFFKTVDQTEEFG